MGIKIPCEIREIALSDATYAGTNTKVVPTFINFFFGNNGAGKSTIAKAVRDGHGVTYAPGKDATGYLPLVFNQEFIDANFRSYRNMRGVFTINEKNVKVQDLIDAKTEEQAQIRQAMNKTSEDLTKKQRLQGDLKTKFYKECWDRMVAIRKEFPGTLDKRSVSRTFTEAILKSTPASYDMEEIRRFYASAFSSTAKAYNEFTVVSDPTVLDHITGSELLGLAIVNTSNTPFADFLEKIGATEWVRQGHSSFAHNAGDRCPYCSRRLDDNFEETLRKSFDTQYTENIDKLKVLQAAYKNAANTLFVPLSRIPSDLYPQVQIKPYNAKLEELRKSIQLNLDQIQKKINEPAVAVTIEPLETILSELQDIIAGYNKLIKENNDIVAAGSKKRRECTDMLFSMMAHALQNEIKAYYKSAKQLEDEVRKLNKVVEDKTNDLRRIRGELTALNSQTVETITAMNSINTMLRDSGFQGFHLEPHEDKPNVYKVVRPNGDIADTLSEGEKNFIAFLFFYHLVRGSETAEGENREKIVVIDDPVSSMDSNSLFIVSAIVREMIEVCRNNADNRNMTATGRYIKQIFILTHNAYFHREITYNYVSKYEYVSFYLIRKQNNKSTIRLCEAKNPEEPSEKMNINPVKNSYAALWDEYRELKSGVPLMNVIRQILEYYFIQLCGYPGATLRQVILKDNKDKFENPDGTEDTERYQLAEAMLSYISSTSIGMSDGLNYIDDCLDPEDCKAMFANIFRWMRQEQHYDKMMGN